MLLKTQKIPTLLACCLSFWGAAFFPPVMAQAPAAAVSVVVAPATLNRLFSEADAAFGEKNYDLAVAKLQELLQGIATNKGVGPELIYFNVGYGYLMAAKGPEAEAAFADCLKRFPKGEYATRCYLGAGRACILQDTPEKKKRAIEVLKIAAVDTRYRSQAGFSLAQVYTDLGRREEALVVLRSLVGSDIRSPEQTSAAVEVLSLLADFGNKADLVAYLDRLSDQAGVRDAIAWYAHQLIGRGEELLASQAYESALVLLRSVPPRNQVIEIQKMALDSQRKSIKILEARVNSERGKPLEQRSSASAFLNILKPSLELAEKELAAVEGEANLDAGVLMRRGRCLYLMNRYEEALVCFRTIRLRYNTAPDAKSAAFGEIVILQKLKNAQELRVLCEGYLDKYPDAENVEAVASMAGELLGQSENWPEVSAFYAKLIAKFPKSPSLDQYNLFLGLAYFKQASFAESTPIFSKFATDFPSSPLVENAMYYLAMSNFLTNKSEEANKSCKEYLSKFPEGRYAGDMRYRLAFIDFSNKESDQTDKIIRDLSSFLNQHPDDASVGSMYCLLGDTYKRKKSDKLDEIAKFEKLSLDAYKMAVWSENPDEVIQYGLDEATAVLQAKKDWAAIAALHSEFLKRKPDSPLALLSAIQISKMSVRQGKAAEAADMLADALKARIGNPSSEQVELMIDELVKAIVPRKKPTEIDAGALETQLADIFTKITNGQESPTSNARLYYAKAQLARLLKRPVDAERYLAGIAKDNAKDPSVLSPALLATSGDILTKLGDFEGAAAMFKRLVERYKKSVFADAGPVGLGYIALAQNKPEEALKIFDEALLDEAVGVSRFKEAVLGKLQALVDLERFDEATKKGNEIISDKTFRGELAGKAYLLLVKARRKQAAKAPNLAGKMELLKQGLACSERLATAAYRSSPDICAEGFWQSYEIQLELGNKPLALEALTKLAADLKLQNTARAKQAVETVKTL
jgi:tetratricopeptide (TPR) repeat protein